MYKVKAWAHESARKSNFNPWSAQEKPQADPNVSEQPVTGENDKDKPKKPLARQLLHDFRVIAFRSWLNVLLIFVPVGIAVHCAGINQNIDFAMNAIAVVPLAGQLTFATETLAHRTTPTIAALLNVSFGNSVELIIFIIALFKNQIRIVQASLIGSILANLLLILGMAMVVGGLNYHEQIYDSAVTQMSSSLLALSAFSLLIPTAFHASFSDTTLADQAVIQISRGTSVILLIIYVLYMVFQLKSHAHLYEGTPQNVIDEQTQPGILRRSNSSSSSSSSSSDSAASTVSTGNSNGWRRRAKKKAKARFQHRRNSKIEEDTIQEEKTLSPDGPAPLPSKIEHTPITAEPETIDGTPATTERQAATGASTSLPNPATQRRPFPMSRGITIRAPPVFRTDSTAQQQIRPPADNLRRFNSTPNIQNKSAPMERGKSSLHGPIHTTTGLSTQTGMPVAPVKSSDEPEISMTAAVILLLASTALVALCAEFMVAAIEYLVDSSPLSEAFVGLIILPIVGNAAEHVTAVVVASKNKLDLALGVSLGSSIQIALLITPFVTLIGWNQGMSLYFTLFETVCLFASVFVVCFLVLDGKSNYLEGALLCGAYIIIAVGAFYFPDSEGQNAYTGGSPDPTKRMKL